MDSSYDESTPVHRPHRKVLPIFSDEWHTLGEIAESAKPASPFWLFTSGILLGSCASGILAWITTGEFTLRVALYCLVTGLVGMACLSVAAVKNAKISANLSSLATFIDHVSRRFKDPDFSELSSLGPAFELNKRLAGSWKWQGQHTATIAVHGAVTCDSGETATWRWIDPHRRLISLVWSSGWVDTLTASEDFSHLSGVNQTGAPVRANRIP